MKKIRRFMVYREGDCIECGHKSKTLVADVGATTPKKAIKRAIEDYVLMKEWKNDGFDDDLMGMFKDAKFTTKAYKLKRRINAI